MFLSLDTRFLLKFCFLDHETFPSSRIEIICWRRWHFMNLVRHVDLDKRSLRRCLLLLVMLIHRKITLCWIDATASLSLGLDSRLVTDLDSTHLYDCLKELIMVFDCCTWLLASPAVTLFHPSDPFDWITLTWTGTWEAHTTVDLGLQRRTLQTLDARLLKSEVRVLRSWAASELHGLNASFLLNSVNLLIIGVWCLYFGLVLNKCRIVCHLELILVVSGTVSRIRGIENVIWRIYIYLVDCGLALSAPLIFRHPVVVAVLIWGVSLRVVLHRWAPEAQPIRIHFFSHPW